MKRIKIFTISLILAAMLLGVAFAGNTATQSITFQVNAINELRVSGNPGTLVIQTGTAGSEPDTAVDSSTTYNLTTNDTNKKIVGQTNSDMPEYTSLKINLTAPTGAASEGDRVLSTSPTDLVTGISKKKGTALGITYKFSAQVEAGIVNSSQRTVTLTVLEGG